MLFNNQIMGFMGTPAMTHYTPEVFPSSPLKNDGWKICFLLGWSIFRGYVKLPGSKGTLTKFNQDHCPRIIPDHKARHISWGWDGIGRGPWNFHETNALSWEFGPSWATQISWTPGPSALRTAPPKWRQTLYSLALMSWNQQNER